MTWRNTETASARTTLHAALRDAEVPKVHAGPAGVNVLLESSRFHGLDHVLLPWLDARDPQHPAIAPLRDRTRAAARFDLVVVGALREALAALPGDLPVAVLKGPVHAHLQRTRGCTRSYADLDLLVAPDRLPEALDSLRAHGAVPVPNGGWATLAATGHAQVPVQLPLGIELDLHWHLSSRPHTRRAFRIDGAEVLLGRAAPIGLAIGSVPALERNDMLLHTAAHAGWSGLDRLGWFADVDAVIRALPPDWDVLVRRACEWRIDGLVADVLERTRGSVGTAIPAEVLRALRGRRRSLAAVADLLAPPDLLPRSRAPGRYLRIEQRASAVATFGALVALGAKAAMRRLGTTRSTPVAERAAPSSDPSGRPPRDGRTVAASATADGVPEHTAEARYYAFVRQTAIADGRRSRRTRRREAACAFPAMLALTVQCRRTLRSTTDLHEMLSALDAWARTHPQRRPRSSAAIVATTVRSLQLLGATHRSCVLQSLVIYTEITRSKTPASFVSGFVKVGSDLDGHAWVESAVLPADMTNDARSAERFRIGFRHPTSRSAEESPEETSAERLRVLAGNLAAGRGDPDDHVPIRVSIEDGSLVGLPLDGRN